jgi:hypothetical protein
MSITRERICRKSGGIVLADRTPAVRTCSHSSVRVTHPTTGEARTKFLELFITVKNADSRDASCLTCHWWCCCSAAQRQPQQQHPLPTSRHQHMMPPHPASATVKHPPLTRSMTQRWTPPHFSGAGVGDWHQKQQLCTCRHLLAQRCTLTSVIMMIR